MSLNEALWFSKLDTIAWKLGKKYGVEVTVRIHRANFSNKLHVIAQIVSPDHTVHGHTHDIEEVNLRRSDPTEYVLTHYMDSLNEYLWRKFTDAGAVCTIMEE